MSSVEIQKIEELRKSLRPENFDEWVCLGGEYRDMVEVQEWSTCEEKDELLSRYADFQSWLRENPK